MFKKLSCLVLSLTLTLSLVPSVTCGATTKVVYTKFEVTDAGMLHIRGYYDNWDGQTDSTILVYKKSSEYKFKQPSSDITIEDITWVDQMPIGNNGAFSYSVHINDNFSEEDAVVALGGGGLSSPYTQDFEVPSLPPTISVVDNNSVLFGRDCYYVPGAHYRNVDTIADSFIFGGYNMYYKLGDNWYNLLDTRATGNEFLKSENAVSENEIISLVPRYYYAISQRFTLRYFSLEEEKS